MRVGNVLLETRVGGPQLRIAEVGRRLLMHGFETVVFFPDEPEARDLDSLLQAHGLRGIRVPVRRFTLREGWTTAVLAAITLPLQVRNLARTFQSEGCDIVHANGIHSPHGALAARHAGLPVVWQMNDCHTPRLISFPLAKLAWRIADRIPVSVEAAGRYHFPQKYDRKSRFPILYAPVDTDHYRPDGPRLERNSTKKVVLTVGNLSTIKGTDLLVKAAEAVLRNRSDVEFWIVGESLETQREFWQPLVARVQARSDGAIRLLGRLDHVDRVMRSADLYVCSSRSEACSMSLLEAMSCEVPVLATSVGGNPELVRHELEGFLVRPSAGCLEKGIHTLLDDPELRRKLGAAGRDRTLESFTAAHAVERHLQIYRSVLKVPS